MSRAPLWQPSAPVAVATGARGLDALPASAAPTAPPVAPCGMLPVRSALAAQVKLARLADLLTEAGKILLELSEVPLADARASRDMTSVETPKRLLTAEDLAARLQVDARTIRRWRKAGKIPLGIEIAGVLRWRADEIDLWLAEGGRA